MALPCGDLAQLHGDSLALFLQVEHQVHFMTQMGHVLSNIKPLVPCPTLVQEVPILENYRKYQPNELK
jgi:hypothetical protein